MQTKEQKRVDSFTMGPMIPNINQGKHL